MYGVNSNAERGYCLEECQKTACINLEIMVLYQIVIRKFSLLSSVGTKYVKNEISLKR